MATGITATLQCDPTTKQEIWLFQQIGVMPLGAPGASGKPLYRRLPYNLVRYDGDPTEFIEPDSACGDFWNILDGSGDPIDARSKGAGLVAEIRYYTARPFEVFSLNEVDVTNNLGQLP
jgi:hypothetical protein